MIAYCGLNCENCDIFKAANDKKLAIKFADELKAAGHEDANPDWFVCQGCKGVDELCFTENCHMRKCCKEKGYENCSFCSEFPCESIKKFAKEGDQHGFALELLTDLKNKREK